ncbi:MAG: response regulator [Alphaproteobacteria bacterium]|nr:response regulator [Alphaproteobacteria bacterium]
MNKHTHIITMKTGLLSALLMVLSILLFSNVAQAQLTRSARIELNDIREAVYIGPDSYITQDAENTLAYQVVVNRHKNNLRGARHNSRVIALPRGKGSSWMLFSVTNNSDQEQWVLDFGQVTNGRLALAKDIELYNANNDGMTAHISTDSDKNTGRTFSKRALPLTLAKDETQLIAVHITLENSLAQTITPYLMSTDAYIEKQTLGTRLIDALIYVFFTAMIGIFTALSYIRQKPQYLLYGAYYALNTALFYLLNTIFFAPFGLFGETVIILFALCILTSLVLTRTFLKITEDDQSENTLLLGAGALIVAAAILAITFLGSTTLGSALLYLAAAVGMLVITALSFFKGQGGQYAGVHYAAAWMCALTGLVITALAATQVLPENILYLNAYWCALIVQGFLFMLSVKKRLQGLDDEERHRRSRESRELQSRARLKHSKESADQARLLRVIERERELMAELREREMQRAEEMRIAKETAVEANRAKSAFLAVVSHEIRTPMTGILGILRLLSDTTLNEEQKDYLLSIQTSGDTMMALLNDILDFEKIERGAMDLEEIDFDMIKLAQGVVTLMSGHAANKGLKLKTDIADDFPRYLKGDPTRLRQILLNLVNNAIKFTQRGEVTIHLNATAIGHEKDKGNADHEIYIAVEDTGIGISKEAQKKLFSPFEQADNTVARRFGGTGLGLAICKRLVEAMGGIISIKSEEGEGSTFYFTILMKDGQGENAGQSGEDKNYIKDLEPMRILVVDDNEMNRKVLFGFLDKGGHEIALAASGEEALALLEDRDFDVVLTDVNLQGGMNGLDLVQSIRENPDKGKAATTVIAVSGNVTDEDIETYNNAGMNGFIAKPIVPEKLYETLEKVQKNDMDQVSTDTPPQEPQTPPVTPSASGADEKALDRDMIQGLLSSLGAEQFKNLMDGYIKTADEIVEALLSLQDSDDETTIREKSHELKGMAANFGVRETSKISGAIEKAAQDGNLEAAHEAIKKLPDANRRAKDAIAALLKP